ncbi:MAG: hypothetical protein ACPIOQ_17035, partial [Promethearchaeia archaeon]
HTHTHTFMHMYMCRHAHESKQAHFDWDDAHMNRLLKGSQYARLNLTIAIIYLAHEDALVRRARRK